MGNLLNNITDEQRDHIVKVTREFKKFTIDSTGESFRIFRENTLCLSLREIAKLSGLSHSTIHAIESGKDVLMFNFKKLVNFYNNYPSCDCEFCNKTK